jgi:hypothetical protein
LRDLRLHECAERKAGEDDRQRAFFRVEARLREAKRRQRIGSFAFAVVEGAFRLADAAKLKRTATYPTRRTSCKRLRHLVVEGAALQRMRVRD